MVRAVCFLFLGVALPISMCAQSAAVNQSGAADQRGHAAMAFAVTRMTPAEALRSAAGAPAKTKTTSDQPPIQGSMVGYIDDAVVATNVRFRYDSAFDDNAPDRAEFFYAQCACDGGTAKGPGPGLVTALNFQQLYMRGEYAYMGRVSLVVDVPVRWIQPQTFDPRTVSTAAPGFPNQAGISDVQGGIKYAILASPQQYLTFQLMASFPTGDSTKGMGTAHYSLAPSLLYYQRMGERFSVESEAGLSQPLSSDSPGFSGAVFNYGVGPSYQLYRGDTVRFAPVIELVGWRVLGGMENKSSLIGVVTPLPVQSSDRINIVNLKAGARTSFGSNSIYVGFGQALTHDMWYKHIVRVEYRRAF
jgi:hypothetical protein